jgi:hypothetical protein
LWVCVDLAYGYSQPTIQSAQVWQMSQRDGWQVTGTSSTDAWIHITLDDGRSAYMMRSDLCTTRPMIQFEIPPPTTRPTTVTPTRLTSPIFGAVVCSSAFDEAAMTPINPSPNKIVAAGTSRIYASWSYQAPDLVTYKYTWYLNGNEVFSGQLKTTDITGTMLVGIWYKDGRALETGSWRFEIKTMDNEILLSDTCIIR